QTLVASLMFPDVNRYEVTPWPNRVFRSTGIYGGSPIPDEYVTELLTVWAAERMMPAEGSLESGPPVIGALTSDTLMWQRKGGRDRFSGHAAPMMALVSRGVPIRVLPVERLAEPDFPPEEIKILIANFDAWKPENRSIVKGMAAWIKSGGVMIFVGGTDDFNEMENAWWIKDGYAAPSDALLDELGIDWKKRKTVRQSTPKIQGMRLQTAKRIITPASGAPERFSALGESKCPLPLTLYGVSIADVLMTHKKKPLVWSAGAGDGTLIYAGVPGELIADEPEGDALFLELVNLAADSAGIDFNAPGRMVMRRGPFTIAFSHTEPADLDGTFVNLLRPENGVSDSFSVSPGEHTFLMDTEKAVSACDQPGKPCVLIASANVMEKTSAESSIELVMSGPVKRTGFALFYMPGMEEAGCDVIVGDGGEKTETKAYPEKDLLAIYFPLTPDGTRVKISLKQ
ncbi:hypothetical protein ACFLQK_01970, partial [bacterium]